MFRFKRSWAIGTALGLIMGVGLSPVAVGEGAAAAQGIPPIRVDLGTLGGRNSQATAVSHAGNCRIVRYGRDAATHAFVYTLPFGPMRDLGTLGYENSAAAAVNGKFVVGILNNESGVESHAFAYMLPRGPMIDLGTLGGTYRSSNRGQQQRRCCRRID